MNHPYNNYKSFIAPINERCKNLGLISIEDHGVNLSNS